MNDIHFYVDDSGTRNPDKAQKEGVERDWFALGGVILNSEDEARVRQLHHEFCENWAVTYPLHSSDIRFKTNDFEWLQGLDKIEQDKFYDDLAKMLVAAPVLGLACVIDRPGYSARYREKYGRQRWSLCKTAFSVIVERAAKFAIARGRRLRIYPERSHPDAEGKLKSYYAELKANGMPFEGEGAAKYGPLPQVELAGTLREFRLKYKRSPPMQVADLYLYPICRSGYVRYKPMEIFREHQKLIDNQLEAKDIPALGIKYSCFELVKRVAG